MIHFNAARRLSLLSGLAPLVAGALAVTAPSAFAQSTAWAGSDADAKAIAQLYDAALKAKRSQVVLYGGYAGLFQPIWDVFAKRFPGITIVPNPISGPRLVSKLDAEFASGQHEGDILMAGMTELLFNVSKDRAQSFRPPNVGALPERYLDPQGRFVIQFCDVFGTVYNTNRVPAADLPKSIQDLADPKHKGLIMDSPLAGGVATLTWIELYHSGKLDPSLMRSLRDNSNVVPSVTPFYANLSTGSVRMIPWGSFTRYLKMKEAGAPVGFHAIPGVVVPLYGGTAVLKGAPNPEAARLFQAWFVTPEAQQALITLGYSYPLLPGVQTPPEWFKLPDLINALKPIMPADYMKVRGEFEATVKKALQ